MSKAPLAHTRGSTSEEACAAARRFADECLVRDGSLFTPGRPIWTHETITDIYARVVENYDVSGGSFATKLAGELESASQESIQLMAELIYFYFLTPNNMSGASKMTSITKMVPGMGKDITIPESLIAALDHGVANPGSGMSNRHYQIAFLLNLALEIKRLKVDARSEILTDPWVFKSFAESIPATRAEMQRQALLHLFFPDKFEPIISIADKRAIVAYFAEIVDQDATDIDQQLFSIRTMLVEERGTEFGFYDDSVRRLWSAFRMSSESKKKISSLGEEIVPYLADPYAALADELLLPVDFLRDVRRLLADKRQVIFYGPPGTGKTFVAQKLAELFAGDPEEMDDGGSVELVQFHPSYAYEDFVQGYRPATGGGFELRDGPLLRIAERARSEPDQKHVLVIDEINRGNVAKLFGELYFLLEYRDRAINLQYADEPFRLPPNLWIIGTMNTADHSIALIDAALRRRFYFVPFFPGQPPIAGLLRRWLERHKPEMLHVADYVHRANELLGDRDAAIGPSHFMKPNLDDEWLELIWHHSVLPYVAEHYFGQEDRVREFELDAIRGEPDDDAVDDATPDAG